MKTSLHYKKYLMNNAATSIKTKTTPAATQPTITGTVRSVNNKTEQTEPDNYDGPL
jgi:hypothetical protein